MTLPHEQLAIDLIWLVIAGPTFATGCALLAKSFRRSPRVWFVLGYIFTAVALLLLVMMGEDDTRK